MHALTRKSDTISHLHYDRVAAPANSLLPAAPDVSCIHQQVDELCVALELSDEGGYTATVPALPGCISEGGTREVGDSPNIREVIELYLEPVDERTLAVPADAEVIEIAV